MSVAAFSRRNALIASRISMSLPMKHANLVSQWTLLGANVSNQRSFAYDRKVIDHYENPRNVGSFNKKDQDVGTGLVGAPACGDVMKL